MSGPTYTYTADTPQASQPFNTTQPLILNNFRAINELLAVNHVGFNVINMGKHNFATMQFQDEVPPIQTDQITMFVQETPDGPNAAEIFITYPNNPTPVQISNGSTTPVDPTGTSSGNSSQGYCTFPSGVTYRWGQITMNLNSGNTYQEFTSGPNYTQGGQSISMTQLQSGYYNTMSNQLNGYIGTNNINPTSNPVTTSGTSLCNYFIVGLS